jgi:hypothetical protein
LDLPHSVARRLQKRYRLVRPLDTSSNKGLRPADRHGQVSRELFGGGARVENGQAAQDHSRAPNQDRNHRQEKSCQFHSTFFAVSPMPKKHN